MSHVAITLSEKPELREHAIADADIWPEFNLQGETYRRLWPRLSDDLPDFQFSMCDEETGEVIAEAPRCRAGGMAPSRDCQAGSTT